MGRLTTKGIKAVIAAGAATKKTDGATVGAGALTLIVRTSGAAFWVYRHGPRGRQEDYSLGPCDPDGLRGMTLAQAREKAAELTRRVLSGVASLREHDAALKAAKEAAAAAAREAEARAQAEAAQRAQFTLRRLTEAYSDSLKAQGKPSWRDARKGPANYLPAEVLDKPAAAVTADDLLPALRTLIDKEHGTSARILRANLRAAYALALRAASDPTIPEGLRGFGVELNPADKVPAAGFAAFRKPGERTLSWAELRCYRARLEALPDGATKDSLMLALLLGGQRPAQLARVREADVDLTGGTITLRDPKGRRLTPRLHTLPLAGRALDIVKRRLEAAPWRPKKRPDAKLPEIPQGERFVLSHRDQRPVDPVRLSKAASAIAKEMIEAKEARDGFRGGDVRRTAETLLAQMRIPSDVRARILSHGVTGVQATFYDKHSYLVEMSEALTEWEARLYAENIVSLGERRAEPAQA